MEDRFHGKNGTMEDQLSPDNVEKVAVVSRNIWIQLLPSVWPCTKLRSCVSTKTSRALGPSFSTGTKFSDRDVLNGYRIKLIG